MLYQEYRKTETFLEPGIVVTVSEPEIIAAFAEQFDPVGFKSAVNDRSGEDCVARNAGTSRFRAARRFCARRRSSSAGSALPSAADP